MTRRHALLVIGGLVTVFLVLSVPGSLREASERGSFYVFSAAFFEDLPKRLTGPGRLRFVFQPLMAILLGIRAGREDARLGRPPFFAAPFRRGARRREILKSTLEGTSVLLLMGILLDSVLQWVLLGVSYPGAALVVGPVLVAAPYALARGMTGLLARREPLERRSA